MVIGTLRGMPYRAASSLVAPDQRPAPMVFRVGLGLLLGLGLLAGCGQRGPLVLPGAAKAASASAPASSTPPPAAASAAR